MQQAAKLTDLDARRFLTALRAFRRGDFSVRLSDDLSGPAGELASEFNEIVRLNQMMAREFRRLSTAVGKEGKIGERGELALASGDWKTCINSVNTLIGDLVQPTTEVARVIGAVARGDLSQTMMLEIDGRPLRGEFLRIGKIVNTMVGQLGSFASEVTRVAREVGTEGKLGGQARVKGVAGTWKDLTDNVNLMAANLTAQVRNIADVTTAVAKGDLSRKITVDVKGEILELKNTINTMVDQLGSFASEVTRVAREVGTEGKLGGQARVEGVAGTWKDLTDNVNAMATNLTGQVRNIAEVTTAVAKGDLSKKITVDVKGEILELKDTINTMVDQLNSFASEVTRVAREVGTEGKLGGQARVDGVAGTWKDLTDNVNAMATNLTGQVRNIAEVTTAVAKGDLSKKITVDVKGEILELKDTINTMVDQLNSFASEVTRVAREVGTEGKLGGQAQVKDVAGTWKDLTDNVNAMATNLTGQVRNIAEVTTAVARGDLSKKITVDVKGEILELKNTINTMVDQLNSFASEVTRVAREVGTEGNLGGQARVEGVAGTWKDLTDNVNAMATNLTGQVRNIAEVTTAVAKGDLSKKITVDVKGEILELKDTINTMVDQLNSFASEVTRVAREVGTEGKLGGQARVEGVAGTWKDLTDNVNLMAANLTGQVRNIAEVTTAVAKGDLSKKITVDVKGEILELKDTINTMVDQLSSFASEVTRVAREVGTEGKLGGQARVEGVAGTWKDLTDNVNAMATNLTGQVRNIAEVTTAVAKGDLSKKITVDVKGEILQLKNTINTMVDQLNSFASEVTRVAREVGTEGNLGGQARVEGVAGTWKDLTDNVNMMATNLTNQVRGIAEVVTAVAQGNLKRKLAVEAKGEIAALANTINFMIETLAIFADQVTNVAREVGIEGKLGGQAKVPGAAGLWRDLTDNVNQLAENLTTQVRAIAEVATAVTKGDLTRSITVQTRGEVAVLKDNINEMIRNLKDTTQKNKEQDWLKTNLARFSRMLQGERDLNTVTNLILSELTPLVNAQHAVFYVAARENDEPVLDLAASYAAGGNNRVPKRLHFGEGLVGQCARDKRKFLLTNLSSDYLRIGSSLGEAAPANILVLPVLFEGEIKAVIELASLSEFSETHKLFLDQLMESIGIVLNTIAATMRTEGLLTQSQLLTHELQSQQEELKKTNDRLELQARSLRESEELLKAQQEELRKTNEQLHEKALLLSMEKKQVEAKNLEVEMAKSALEEKAEQLALTSKYKSEFLANMSHELRTPLNSLLILSKMLAENTKGNLTEQQIEFSRTIHDAGSDLLALINDILDLSKIESGTVSVEIGEVSMLGLRQAMERTFSQMAADKGLNFTLDFSAAPKTIKTDEKRLQQIVKNLISNAVKFTHEGEVRIDARVVDSGWSLDIPVLKDARQAIAITVTDTGIGIPEEKQRIIFEAFQQADGTTSRKYGGTGLGLSISREIARLLGGEIQVVSQPNRGSRFTLFLPLELASQHDMRVDRALVRAEGEQVLSLSRSKLPEIADDRDQIDYGDAVALIVDSDLRSAEAQMEIIRSQGLKAVVTLRGSNAVALAKRYDPSVVTLKLPLADADGVVLLDQLKQDPATAHLPVHVIAEAELVAICRELGAASFSHPGGSAGDLQDAINALQRIRSQHSKTVLLLHREKAEIDLISSKIGEDVHNIEVVSSPAAARERMQGRAYAAMIVELGTIDASLYEYILSCQLDNASKATPILLYGANHSDDGGSLWREKLRSIGIPEVGIADLRGALLQTLQHARPLPDPSAEKSAASGDWDRILRGTKILIVDDDIRNIFSMTSILEQHNMRVVHAENGRAGVEALKNDQAIELALIDIMMPDMDGYETMRVIRQHEELRDLPLIAVTAKAMAEDREKCIQAGASDYVSKPVNVELLLSMIRTWLLRRRMSAGWDLDSAASAGFRAEA